MLGLITGCNDQDQSLRNEKIPCVTGLYIDDIALIAKPINGPSQNELHEFFSTMIYVGRLPRLST